MTISIEAAIRAIIAEEVALAERRIRESLNVQSDVTQACQRLGEEDKTAGVDELQGVAVMGKGKITTLDKLPDLLTPQQVADYVGIARQRVYDFCQYGEIKSFTIGASRKIRKADMLEWLDRISGA